MSETIMTIGVVGAGQMGAGIAQVAAATGYSVLLTDISDAALERGMTGIRKNLNYLVHKKQVLTTEEAELIIDRIQTSIDVEVHSGAQLIIEAATERVDLKYSIFESLSQIASEGTILASNTSSISITSIAAHTDCPELVMGMHFMNPVPRMKLVELIRGMELLMRPIQRLMLWLKRWEKPLWKDEICQGLSSIES